MMRTSRVYALSLALLAIGGLSCDRLTAPSTTGAIDVAIPGGTLDAVRVTVSGATNKTVTMHVDGSATSVNVDGLLPGTYAVTVEGLVGGEVARYGESGGVAVSAGNNSTAHVALSLFQPVVTNFTVADTVRILRFTVEYSPVTHANAYIVQWSRSHTLAGATFDTVSATSTEIVVPDEGQYYFVVRAVNERVPSGGLASAMRTVYAFQAVATVAVLPATPSIVDGQTQQFTFVARDADNNILTGITPFWASSNNAVATVSQTGLVTSVSSGQTAITAIAKGVPGSTSLTVTPQAASKLVFTEQPTSTTGGQSISSIKVAVQNPKNQTATSDNTTQVTLAIAANPGGGALTGTATATVQQGVATFNNLSINKTGANYTLTATANSLATATSAQFDVRPGAASVLAFTSQPGSATAGASLASALQVEIRDGLGNRVTSARDAVTIAIGNNPSGGTLSGTKVVNAIDGVATFSGLSIDKIGTGYTLTANGGGLPQVTSGAFDIVAPGTATKLAFTVQPTTVTADDNILVTVNTTDSFGNNVSAVVPVTIAIVPGTGGGGATLTGTTTITTSGGQAVFTDLRITHSDGGYKLVATSGSLSQAISTAFSIDPGSPTELAFGQTMPSPEPGGLLGGVSVIVVDAYGNVPDVAVDITVALDANPGGATLSGTTTQTTVGGGTTFFTLSIDNFGNGYTLSASAAGLPTVISPPFDVSVQYTSFSYQNFAGCGITVTSSAYCHGWGGFGERGDGTFIGDQTVPQPVRVSGGHAFSSIGTMSGSRHTCAIRASDNQVLCWGRGNAGQLGSGGNANLNEPTLVTGGVAFASVSTGETHSCGIRADNGRVMCWGAAANGRLGNNTNTPNVSVPTLTNDVDAYVAVSAGSNHTCGIRASDLRVLCWGAAGNGRLGNSTTTPDVLVPALMTNASQFASISAGSGHTCGIRTDGRAMCWGLNGNGQLGNGDNTFTEQTAAVDVASGLIAFTQIAAGSGQTCGVTLSGQGLCWGDPTFGRLGNGSDLPPTGLAGFSTPQAVLGGHTFISVTPNNVFSTCGRTNDGVFCWGINGNGQSGNGTFTNSSVPVRVIGTR